LRYLILGPLEVREGDDDVELRGGQQRKLLAILLLHSGEAVSSDLLIEELWNGTPPETAAKALQGYVSSLRKQLGREAVETVGAGYRLVEPEDTDVRRFEELLAEARPLERAPAVAKLREALALWRGPALADFVYDDFARNEIDRLEELRLGAIERRIDLELALGHHDDLVPELEALVHAFPLRERLRGHLMVALYRSGRQAEALDAYRDARAALRDELGLEPSEELQALQRAILDHDPSLAAPPRVELSDATGQSRLLVDRRFRRPLLAVALGLAILVGTATALGLALTGASAAPLTGCELTPNPPLNDRAFNQAIYDGLTDASTSWGISVRDKVPKTLSPKVWNRDMDDLIRQRCSLIVTAGSAYGSAVAARAKANPSMRFATTDAIRFGPNDPVKLRGTPNLLSIEFKSEQAAFLAGYLAAGMSKTGKVGTFGGIPIPTVTRFMNGFAAGILYYNRVHGTHVRLIGWNPKGQTGTFVSDDSTQFSAFTDEATAKADADYLVLKGADIIFPVDGPQGDAGACRTALANRDVRLIGVDTDQHYSTPDCVTRWLTSAEKIYRRMVYLAMGQIVHHQFKGGLLEGTLKNGGVGLAPFYGSVPKRLRDELPRVKRGIINHSITVDPRNYLSG
jgi:basic membrane lipoprotein Med (substrate-binding protein (PBP1-ABC) superfamily)/DNA-binding SARP family transcriptional activator